MPFIGAIARFLAVAGAGATLFLTGAFFLVGAFLATGFGIAIVMPGIFICCAAAGVQTAPAGIDVQSRSESNFSGADL